MVWSISIGIRFRSHGRRVIERYSDDGNTYHSELDGSEMTHFCNDMWPSGDTRIGMDSMIQVTYDKQLSADMVRTHRKWFTYTYEMRQQRINKLNNLLLK